MESFRPDNIQKGIKGINICFVSKRLAIFILKKSDRGKWIYTYLPLHNIAIGQNKDYICYCICAKNGLILAYKRKRINLIYKHNRWEII